MSAPELERDTYDVVVIGTGLAESIAAAALAKAGKSVLHLDPNEYYGSSQASLTLDELISWSWSPYTEAAGPYTQPYTSFVTPELNNDRRRYALSLFPAALPSRGTLIDTLVSSDVSKYVSFRMLDSVSVWDEGVKRVPGSKEEVFKDKSVSLMEKRKLMKFLMFAGGDFEKDAILSGKEDQPLLIFLQESFALPVHLATSIAYAIAHCDSAEDTTLPALQRTRRYLRSVGRYGSGAFLVGQYGGAGEVAQGFCRACAVFGGTYVLGASARPTSIKLKNDQNSHAVELQLPCHPRPVRTKHLIAAPTHLPPDIHPARQTSSYVAKCIAITNRLPPALKRPVTQDEGEGEGEGKEEDDTAVVLFPPTEEGDSVVRAFVMGEGTGSCPPGQFILYFSQAIKQNRNPQDVLRPFLHKLVPEPLFEAYHNEKRFEPAAAISQESKVVVLQPYGGTETLTEGLDWEAEQGKAAYLAVMGNGEGVKGFFEKEEGEGEEEDEL